ncbi:phospholipase A and acyltransferase 2-like [Haliotis rubra]|uniref:phospholipase A and acyltransferase 2-like n=1 Tax=Haliotis rubra TaxID=36100 RepID=UPI001EE51335|nr:phospholipase A and acyltransferase 2-like [Haliotis rubra]
MASLELQRHNQTVLDNLELGDRLQFKRGVYSHWAVYVGNSEVVHLSGADGAGGSDLKHPCTISGTTHACLKRRPTESGYNPCCLGDKEVVHLSGVDGPTQSGLFSSVSISGAQFDNGIIRKDAFWDVVGLSEVCQNNSKDEKLKYFEPSEIVQRALSKIGKVGYNILFNNCEHFATWCRYGKEESDQVQGLFDAVAEVGEPL